MLQLKHRTEAARAQAAAQLREATQLAELGRQLSSVQLDEQLLAANRPNIQHQAEEYAAAALNHSREARLPRLFFHEDLLPYQRMPACLRLKLGVPKCAVNVSLQAFPTAQGHVAHSRALQKGWSVAVQIVNQLLNVMQAPMYKDLVSIDDMVPPTHAPRLVRKQLAPGWQEHRASASGLRQPKRGE